MIPKYMHFIWLGDKELPVYAIKNIKKWEFYYPNFNIKIWSDSDIENDNVIPTQLTEHYNNNPFHPAFKADIARYCILQKYGGLYLDTDFEPLKRLPDHFLNFEFLGGIQNNGEVAIGFIGSAVNSVVLNTIIDELPKSIEKNKQNNTFVNKNITGITGPKFVTPICNKFKYNSNCFFFTSEYFYPYWADEKHRRNEEFLKTSPLAYAVHHWAAEWLEN